jgi:hypothetical protein
VAKALECLDRTGCSRASRGPATGSGGQFRPGDGGDCSHVNAVLSDEGNILLKTFQYLIIGAGFSVWMLFMLALALTDPLI